MERDYQQEREEKTRQLVKDFENLVNGQTDPEIFFDQFKRCHRTLQQKMFGMMVHIIVLIASDDYHTDGRNVHTQKTAQNLIKGYAKQMREVYYKEFAESRYYSPERAAQIADEEEQGILKNPLDYLSMPLI